MRNSFFNKQPNSWLWKYAALTTQLFVAIAISMYLGWLVDGWLTVKTPITIWVLPLATIISIIIKIIIDTHQLSKKNRKYK